jgi:hypothetical protein
MRQKLLFVFCLVLSLCITAVAQKRSVTNADLELYRQKRLAAERDYRENFERLGFPSPEELERRSEASQQATIALSERLRAERLQREQIEAAQEALARQAAPASSFYPGYSDNTIYGAGWLDPFARLGRRGHGGIRGRFRGPTGYFAGGNFWPAPVGSVGPPRPILRVSVGGRHR